MYYKDWAKVKDTVTLSDDAWNWVHEHLGGPDKQGLWYYQDGYYYFKHERDMTLYLLLWSGADDSILEKHQ